MLLQSLRLHNFRQYRGDQSISFSTDPQKNVTVILGDNTYGKTTLLQAFNWCFYEKVMLDNPDDLLNYDVANEMQNGSSEDVEVQIEFIHGGLNYTLIRTRRYTKTGADIHGSKPTVSMSFIDKDGQTNPIKSYQVDNVVKSILPEGLSSYFFFDTERVASVSTRGDLRDSVKGLLGLTVLENGINHLGSKAKRKSVLGKLYGSLDEDGDKRAKEALARIQDSRERLDANDERLKECNSQIEQLTAQKDQYDELLRENSQSKSLEAEKERHEKSVRAASSLRASTITAMQRGFSSSSMHFFSAPLIDRAEQLLKDAQLDDKGIKDLTRPTLEDILARGICVCGLKFPEHPEAVEHVREEMRYCPPESIGTAVRNYQGELSRFATDQESTLASMQSWLANIFSATQQIQDGDEQIGLLSARLQQLPNLSSTETARNGVKKALKKAQDKRDSILRESGELQSTIERLNSVYAKTSSASAKNKKTFLYIQYAETIAKWLNDEYTEEEGDIRERLQSRVNDIFNQMYHGHRKVVIDSNYEVQLITDLGENSRFTGESEGLNRVKNFAFIAGLVSLAKEKVVAKSGDTQYDLSSEPYPLVMDAPFSNTDERHIANISRVLPEASEQVIMFVMNKDWVYARPVLQDRLGASYALDKRSEEYSVLKREG